MCELKRRDFLLGASAMLLYGCGDTEKYNQGKDFYPVADSYGRIVHWGKNTTININTDANSAGNSTLINYLKAGFNQWVNTLNDVGISINYDNGSEDVKVHWYSASEMEAEAKSSGVLALARQTKNIYMRTDLESYRAGTTQSTAVHEFGHMLGIWTHSFDSKDIMYPYSTSVTELSDRDKKTLTDLLYTLTPSINLKNAPLPIIHSETVNSVSYMTTYYTTKGCKIHAP